MALCPGHNRLFDPPFVELARRVRAGEIGRVVAVRAEQGFTYEGAARSAAIPWSYTYDWGIYENLMPHPLYLVRHFLEEPGEPSVVGFNLGRVREAGVEEMRVLIPSRAAVGEVVLSMTTAPMHNRVEVIGTKGRMTADYVSLQLVRNVKSPLPRDITRITSIGASAPSSPADRSASRSARSPADQAVHGSARADRRVLRRAARRGAARRYARRGRDQRAA